MCSLLGSLKGLKGTKDMTTAPRLDYLALSIIPKLVQESVTGNAAANVGIAKTPTVVPEKSDLGVKMKLAASHLFVICHVVPPT